jgi:hypothetical protein
MAELADGGCGREVGGGGAVQVPSTVHQKIVVFFGILVLPSRPDADQGQYSSSRPLRGPPTCG